MWTDNDFLFLRLTFCDDEDDFQHSICHTFAWVSTMNVGYFSVTILVTFVGIIGNLLVICALLVHRKLRVLNNLFIANLALADLFVAGVIHPFTALGITSADFFYHKTSENPTAFCKFLGSFCIISCSSSIFSITAVAINRYVYICHRQTYPKIYTRVTVTIMLAGIWMLSALVDLPNFVGWGRHVFHSKTATCLFDTIHYGYKLYFIVISVAIPIAITGFCYSRIVILVFKSERRLQNRIESENAAAVNHVKPADVKLLKTVAIIGAMGLFLYTPFALTLLFDNGQIPHKVWMFSTGLMHSYSCINWGVYALSNSRFRNAYVHFLKTYLYFPFHHVDIKEIDGPSSVRPSQMEGRSAEMHT